MNIFIGNPILSVEFRKTSKYDDIKELNSNMEKYFQNKSYSDDVEKYSIGLICVSSNFDSFFKPKRPKYYADKTLKAIALPDSDTINIKKMFSCELKLDYLTFFQSNKEEGYNIIAKSLMKFLEELKYPSAIKTFDKKSFNEDMKNFFIIIGCSL